MPNAQGIVFALDNDNYRESTNFIWRRLFVVMKQHMKFIVKLNILVICILLSVSGYTQSSVIEAQARAELDRRGLTEQEVITALLAEGIDIQNINDIQDLSAAQLERMQTVIQNFEQDKKRGVNRLSVPEPDTIPAENVSIGEEVDLAEESPDSLEESIYSVIEVDSSTLIYGQTIFRDGSIDVFQQGDDLQLPDSYILGVGDEISVSIFGRSQFEDKYKIRGDGYIRILDGNRRVLLKGTNIKSARDKLYKAFSNYYNFSVGEFELIVSSQRSVNVGIYGEVNRVGSFKLIAFNNAINALVASGGPNSIGTLRRIQLLKAAGGVKVIDVYEYLNDPSQADQFYIEDNDVIHVPVQGNIVTVEGAVKRPMRYEMLADEDLSDLLVYAGGLRENAYRRTFELYRYENDQRIKLDISYSDLLSTEASFKLMDGDRIVVEAVESDARNYVTVQGEVINKGEFERRDNMTVSDLVDLAGLKPESYTPKALLIRTNFDQTKTFTWLNIDEIVQNKRSPTNIILADRDVLTIWDRARYADRKTFSVKGAVRVEGEFVYDEGDNLRVTDAIFLAGGKKSDAGNIVMIYRKDPLVPNSLEYIKVNLVEIENNPESLQNIQISGFDVIELMSRNKFEDDQFVGVQGAVNNPGDFPYGQNMTVGDAIILAQGLKLGASTNNIEVSRLVFQDNDPTKTVVANLTITRDFEFDETSDANYVLEPYDNVYIRYVPEFELQKEIKLSGEVKYPGPYSLLNDNERITDVFRRAGGLSDEAFPDGAKLFRHEDSLGYIVLRLEEALIKTNSKYNYILKDGDEIHVPKKLDFVTISGATRVDEVLDSTIIGPDNEIQVAYHQGKDALFYIDYYAGGLHSEAKKNLIFVENANGEVKKTKRRFPFGYKYPEVKNGSHTKVRSKSDVELMKDDNKEEVDWTRVLGDSVAQAMSILTLILLIQRLD